MNHRNAFRKLSRTPAHRRATLRNLATNLVLHNRIKTTLPKAKELRRIADKLVTLGKRDSHHARRQAMSFLNAIHREEHGFGEKWTAVHKLFTEIAPRYASRNGGYTRVVRLGPRPSDTAEMAYIEFVEGEVAQKETKKKRRTVRKSASKSSSDAQATENAA